MNPTVKYHNLSPAAECEVFQHVQLGVSLTTAKKLQAISSPWANHITHLEKMHLMIDGGLVNHIAFDDTHGRAFQNTAQLIYCCAGLPTAQHVPSATKLEKWLVAPDEHPSAAFNAVSMKRSSAKKHPPVNVSWQNANMRLTCEWLMPVP
jgi:hypothetical protein